MLGVHMYGLFRREAASDSEHKNQVFEKSNGYHCLQSIEPVEGGSTYANIREAVFLNAVAVLKRSL